MVEQSNSSQQLELEPIQHPDAQVGVEADASNRDSTQQENPGIASAYARYGVRARRQLYVKSNDILLCSLDDLDNGSVKDCKVHVQLARLAGQKVVKPFKIFVRMEKPTHKPRAIFDDEGHCEDSVFFTAHHISLIYDYLMAQDFMVTIATAQWAD